MFILTTVDIPLIYISLLQKPSYYTFNLQTRYGLALHLYDVIIRSHYEVKLQYLHLYLLYGLMYTLFFQVTHRLHTGYMRNMLKCTQIGIGYTGYTGYKHIKK